MKLGLTGGIGCGKSTVVGLFKEAGWCTVETDALVRDLLAEDAEVQAQLASRWGREVFREDGTVDRKAIAARVFSDPDSLEWLESLLHPRVRKSWEAILAAHPNQPSLVEIPLLFEKRLETQFDLTVCIACSPEVVDSRMLERGYSAAEIAQRRERQMPLEDKIQRADYLIANSGSLEFLKRQTNQLIGQIAEG